MAPRSSLYRLADDKLEGRLAAVLLELRADGASWEQIAQRLCTDHGISVTRETVRLWHAQLIEPEQVAS